MKSRRLALGFVALFFLTAVVSLVVILRGGNPAVAVMEGFSGPVDHGDATNTGWKATRTGDEFRLNEAVRTAAGATATVRIVRAGGGFRLGPATILRFVPGARGQQVRARVESGSVEVETLSEEIQLMTPSGPVSIIRGSRVRVTAQNGASRFTVDVGRVSLERSDGSTLTAGPSEALEVSVERAVVERVAEAPPPPRDATRAGGALTVRAATEEPGDAGTTAENPDNSDAGAGANTDGAVAESSLRSGTNAIDVSLSTGESATIHGLRNSVAVRFRHHGLCAQGGDLVLGENAEGAGVRGTEFSGVELGPGNHAYKLYCVVDGVRQPQPAAQGTVRVARDDGAHSVAPRRSHSTVDTDGHRYTIVHEDALPSVTVVWNNPPPGTGFTLHVRDPAGRSRTIRRPNANATISGMTDGAWHAFFVAPTGARSADTTIQVDGDRSVEHAAQISEPRTPTVSPGDVRVAGAVRAGSVVEVEGQSVTVDGTNHFDTSVRFTGEARSMVIRIVEPGGGVHYYLRPSSTP